jgi:ElaB/YqjD/DUF883 family membrane-anchored ribosome-binding protein
MKSLTLRKKSAITDQAMHKHAYKAISIAAGIGALVGFIIGRSGHSQNNE